MLVATTVRELILHGKWSPFYYQHLQLIID